MRILHVCGPTSGGTAVVVRDLVAAGLRRGHQVAVASPAHGPLREWVESMGASWHEADLRRAPHMADFAAVSAVRKLMRSADVVHLHSSKAGAVGRLATICLPNRPRVVFTPHAWSWYVGGSLAAGYRQFERWAARRSDLIVAVSSDEMSDGRDVLGAKAPLTLIENGVDLQHFSPEGSRAARELRPLVVTVGRLSEQKGQDRLITALANISRADIDLRILGSGPDEKLLRDLARELGVGDRVQFLGDSDPRPHLRAADVVVLPSRWEGMSLVMLEAMACGCAVIATRCGGTDALDGVGVVINEDDETSVITAIQTEVEALVADPNRREELKAKARERAVSRFDIRYVEDLYQQAWSPASPKASVGASEG